MALAPEFTVVGVRAQRQGQPLEFRARLVVGDDGGHSRVRAGPGIPLPMQEFPLDFLVPKRALAESSLPIGRGWIDPSGVNRHALFCLLMPLPMGQTAMAIGLTRGAYERLSQSGATGFQEAMARLSPACAALTAQTVFPDGFVRIQRPFGHASRYVADGAALLGDAAHPVTPIGGQGANMSVADALVLAEVAHEALKHDDCRVVRLQPYETIRRPANERSLRFSRTAQRLLGGLISLPWLGAIVPRLIKDNDRPERKQRFLRALATAFLSPTSARPTVPEATAA